MSNNIDEIILVTGGTGLLGSYLLKELAGKGQPIRAIYRNKIPEWLDIPKDANVDWVQGELEDVLFVEDCMQGIAEIYHCAGLVSFNPSRKKELLKTNVECTANIVNAALSAGVRKMIHVSSVSALGRKRDYMTVTEEVKWEEESGLSAYGQSKYLAELEVWRGVGEGLEAAIVNPTVILGFAGWDKGSAATFKNAYDEFPWYSDGSGGFVDAADVARAMYLLMKSDISGERFILSAENRSYKSLFDTMASAFKKRPPRLRANKFLAGIVWRLEAIKKLFTGKDPLLTRETAEIAQLHVNFSSEKIKKYLPGFEFKPLSESISQYCSEYLVKMTR
ncbi:NAD-dependent epimerase/dehydratase family protein [Pollutibacter soli]|uniref:NAD-dependent epimerase/dehydratase family protein n=1 Tax=Pollutibacter soli TaxID=3034157 RepID=UPI0030136FC6